MANSRFILLFLWCAVALSFGNILRLPCKNFADFSVEEENSGLNSDALLRTIENTNREECRTECLNNKRCKSFSTKESENSCELYNQSSEDPKDDVSVEDRPGWLYHSTYYADPLAGPTCRRKNPCPGRRCMDTCVYPGYLCNENVYVQVPTQQPCCTATVQTCCMTAQPTTAQPATTAKPATTDKPASTAAPSVGKIDQTTAAPSTAAPTTAKPSTAAPTTAKPSTAAPTTAKPTTAAPTSAIKLETTRAPIKLRVKIVSQGYFSPNKPSGTVGIANIYVNGKDHSKKKRGYNVVVVDENTGRVEDSKDFDTFKGMFTHARKKMKKFVASIPDGKIVLVAIQDEGSRKAEPEVYEALKMIHGTEPFQKAYRGSFAMIGYKGPKKPSWVVQEQPGDLKKDAVIEKTLFV